MFIVICKYVVNQSGWFFCDPCRKSHMRNKIVTQKIFRKLIYSSILCVFDEVKVEITWDDRWFIFYCQFIKKSVHEITVKLMMLHSGMFIYNSNHMVFVIRDYQFNKYRFQFFCTVAIYEGPFEVYIKGFGKYTSKLLQQRIQ